MSSRAGPLLALLALLAVACGASPPLEAGTMAPLPMPANMIVIGDFGSGSDAQHRVAERIRETVAAEDIELFLTTGDNFYNDDIERIWNDPYGWLDEESLRIAAAWGNHDRDSETRRMLVQENLDPPGAYYSMELGEGKLIVLDSNNVSDRAQTEWFRTELEGARSPTIVVFHHPPYSCGVYGTEDLVNDDWLPLFEELGVTLVLNGHEHHYERFVVDDTTYVVTGGGGQGLRSAEGCPEDTPAPISANYSEHHFVLIRAGGGMLTGEVIATDGSTIDSFEIGY